MARGQECSPERLRINAEDLIDIEQEALRVAFAKARREHDYYPSVAEIRRMAQVDEAAQLDAEARKAWELTEEFVRKYVDTDVYGNYGPEHGWYRIYPQLCDRILDTVRRTGGWRAYKKLTDKDFPFQQKRFFDEYKAWTAVERLTDPSKLLVIETRPQLVEGQPRVPTPNAGAQVEKLAKPMPEYKPLSSEELERRKSEQLAAVRAKYGNTRLMPAQTEHRPLQGA